MCKVCNRQGMVNEKKNSEAIEDLIYRFHVTLPSNQLVGTGQVQSDRGVYFENDFYFFRRLGFRMKNKRCFSRS